MENNNLLKENKINFLEIFLQYHRELLLMYYIDNINNIDNINDKELQSFFKNLNNYNIDNNTKYGLTRCYTTVELFKYYLYIKDININNNNNNKKNNIFDSNSNNSNSNSNNNNNNKNNNIYIFIN